MPSATEPNKLPRPRPVTLAASLVMAASLMLVVSVFESLANLRSLETREEIDRFLSEPPGSDLGLGLESVLTILRTTSMVAAGLATAAAILGWHVLRRSRSARLGLTILAVPLFLSGLVTGGFLASVVLASTAMLWLAPSRHWFAGTTPPTVDEPRGDAPRSWPPPYSPQQPSQTPSGQAQDPPRADVPPLPPPGPSASQQPPPWTPYAGPAPWTVPVPGAPQVAPPRRPSGLVVACVITWTCCAVSVLLSVLLIAVLAVDTEALFAEMQRQNPDLADQGVSDATLQSATWVTAIVMLVWGLLSSALAALTFRRIRWAAIALAVSAGGVALLCLGGSLLSPPLVLPGVLAAVAAVLLLQPSAQRWLSRREGGETVDRARGMM